MTGARNRATTRVAPTPLLPIFREVAGCPKETGGWIPASAGMTREGRNEGCVGRQAGRAGMMREGRNEGCGQAGREGRDYARGAG